MRNFLVTKSKKGASRFSLSAPIWLRGLDLNQRPLGYEPNELPDCSTPHWRLYRNQALSARTRVFQCKMSLKGEFDSNAG
jgi:hypothetical protein